MDRRAAIGLIACAAWACADEPVRIGPDLSGMESAILVVEVSGSVALTVARVDDAASSEVRADGDVLITALGFVRTLEQLGLDPGPATLDPSGVRLPFPDRIQQALISGAEAVPFSELASLPEPLSQLRIRAPSSRDCVDAGGCFTPPDPAGYRACLRSCPAPTSPTPPVAPTPPNFLPCPSGWSALQKDGLDACEPFPAGPSVCVPGSLRAPGARACQRLGPSCAAFASDLPSGSPIRYVDLAAAPGGDGSRAQPHADLASALAAAGSGEVVALAPGVYPGPVTLPDGVRLWGACGEGTRLELPLLSPAAVLTLQSGQAAVHNLSLAGGRRSLSVEGGELTLQNVEVGTSSTGAWVIGGALLADGLVLRQEGLVVVREARAELSRAVVIAPPVNGLSAFGGTIIGRDLVVIRARARGVHADSGGHLELSRVVILGSGDLGLGVLGVGSTASVSDLVVRQGALRAGAGIAVHERAELVAQRVLLEDVPGAPLWAVDGSRAELSDLIVRDSGTSSVAPISRAVYSSLSSMVLTRAAVLRNYGTSVSVRGSNASLTLHDVQIVDGASFPDRGGGRALLVSAATVELARVQVLRGRVYAVQLEDHCSLSGSDLAIDDSLTDLGTELRGRGLFSSGSTLHLDRARIARARGAGMLLSDGSDATLTDLLIDGVESSLCEGLCGLSDGVGAGALVGSSLSLERFDIGHAQLSAMAFEQNTTVTLKNGRLHDSQVGLRIVSPDQPLDPALEGVTFSNNEFNVLP